jgi:hypothetical protein
MLGVVVAPELVVVVIDALGTVVVPLVSGGIFAFFIRGSRIYNRPVLTDSRAIPWSRTEVQGDMANRFEQRRHTR